jgi:hypothetical protein
MVRVGTRRRSYYQCADFRSSAGHSSGTGAEVAMYEDTIMIGELWVDHPALLGVLSARLVVAFGDSGLELWRAGVLRIRATKDISRQ